MRMKPCLALLFFLLGSCGPAYALSWDADSNTFVWDDSLNTATSTTTLTSNNTSQPTRLRSSHFIELRQAIDYAADPAVCNVPGVWGATDESARAAIGSPGISVSSQHINAMRQAVAVLYTAKGQPTPPAIAQSTSSGTKIQASHIQDLRDSLDYLVKNYCSAAAPVTPSCTGGRIWDGAQCSCMPDQTFNGTQCVAIGTCPSGTFIFEMPFGQYTSNADTDCSIAINKTGFNPLNTFWYKQDCVGSGTPPGDYCIVQDSRRIQDARQIGCGGPSCIYCSLVTRSLMCSGTTTSGGGGSTSNRRLRQIN